MSWLIAVSGLVLGFVILIFCGDWLVRGCAALARRLGLPPLLIGLTILAFGTSAPELFVSVQAVLRGTGELALGNIVGSNTANLLLVLGLSALFCPLTTRFPGARRSGIIACLAAAAFTLLCWMGPLGFIHGLILLTGLVLYLGYCAWLALRPRHKIVLLDLEETEDEIVKTISFPVMLGLIVVGLAGLPLGSHLVVTRAETLAEAAHIPPSVIGLTLIAFGTSLPELAAALAAAFRRHTELILGNVLGSNIFNIFAVGGVSAMAGKLYPDTRFLQMDLWVMLGASLVVMVLTLGRLKLSKPGGAIFLLIYGVYLTLLGISGFSGPEGGM